jgi:biopolymer transport protein ExbD
VKAVAAKSRPMLDAGGVSATDIIMNLFVFFFIAFSLLATFEKQREETATRERQQKILLPASQREAPALAFDAIRVEMGLERQAWVDGRPVPEAQVTAAVRAALGPQRKNVVVMAHKDLSLGATVGLMDQVWAAGPENVALATLPGEAKR